MSAFINIQPALEAAHIQAVRVAAHQHRQRAEDTTRRLLGLWVSELEPTVAYNEEYEVIGLSYGNQILVRA